MKTTPHIWVDSDHVSHVCVNIPERIYSKKYDSSFKVLVLYDFFFF